MFQKTFFCSKHYERFIEFYSIDILRHQRLKIISESVFVLTILKYLHGILNLCLLHFSQMPNRRTVELSAAHLKMWRKKQPIKLFLGKKYAIQMPQNKKYDTKQIIFQVSLKLKITWLQIRGSTKIYYKKIPVYCSIMCER